MKITVIGVGAMGGSFVDGLLMSGYIQPSDITVTAAHQQSLLRFKEQNVNTTTDNALAAKEADLIILAVKPWIVQTVVETIKPIVCARQPIVVSFAAGISSAQLFEWFGNETSSQPTLFTVMPNIAIAVRSSMTFIVPLHATKAQTTVVKNLFDQLGESKIIEERQLGAGMMLASCGIAFAMRYARASAEGGVELGFKAKEATQIVLQTMKGAVDLLQANHQHPEVAIDNVTTPGGVTIRGLNEMEHAGFTSAVIRGLKAGVK